MSARAWMTIGPGRAIAIAAPAVEGIQPVALERLLELPPELDGSAGANRYQGGSRAQIPARNDLEALHDWMRGHARENAQTYRAYLKEAERLLLWALLERGKPFSSLDTDDVEDYFGFLLDPAGTSSLGRAWLTAAAGAGRAPLRARRASNDWRPFRGRLSTASINQARSILNACFGWLVEARYLAGNPLAIARRRRSRGPERSNRYLPPDAWGWMQRWLDAMPAEGADAAGRRARARHVFALLYLTGIRLSELADARMSDLFRDDDGHWWLRVRGKGSKAGTVPVSAQLMESVAEYRRFHGMAPRPSPGDATPLVLPLSGVRPDRRPLSANMIHRIVSAHFEAAADEALARGESDVHAALKDATAHWMRHTSLTHQIHAGVDLLVAQRNARHADINTTTRYLHTHDAERHAQTSSRLSLRGPAARKPAHAPADRD